MEMSHKSYYLQIPEVRDTIKPGEGQCTIPDHTPAGDREHGSRYLVTYKVAGDGSH